MRRTPNGLDRPDGEGHACNQPGKYQAADHCVVAAVGQVLGEVVGWDVRRSVGRHCRRECQNAVRERADDQQDEKDEFAKRWLADATTPLNWCRARPERFLLS